MVSRKTWVWVSEDGISSFDSSKSLEQVTPLGSHSLYHEAGVMIHVKHARLSSKCHDKSVANKTKAPSDEAPSNPQVAGCPCALFMLCGGSEDLGKVTNRSGGSESTGPHLSTILALKN